MATAVEIIENIASVSDFSRGRASSLFEAAQASPVTVVKNNRPYAVLTSVAEFCYLSEIEEDYWLLCEALNRLESADEGKAKTQAEVLAEFHISEADMAAAPDFEIE